MLQYYFSWLTTSFKNKQISIMSSFLKLKQTLRVISLPSSCDKIRFRLELELELCLTQTRRDLTVLGCSFNRWLVGKVDLV